MVASGTTRTCPSCGTEARAGERFCRSCGTDLDAALAGARAPTAPVPPATAMPAPPPAPPPMTTRPIPPQAAPMAATPAVRIAQPTPWPAWLGVAACGVLAIATGLDWLSTGGFSADAFDIAFGALFSDTAVDGISIAVVLVILAALGIAVGLLAPRAGTLGVALLIVGVLGTLIVGWYMIRILTSDGGSASLFSIGLYLALAGALAVVVSGAVLSASGKRRAA